MGPLFPAPTTQCPGFDCKTLNMATKMEESMLALIGLFHSYASKGGDPKKLSKNEMKELMNNEFPTFMAECKDPAELKKMLADLDLDGDGQIDFNEFAIMLCTLTMVCNEVL